MTTAATSRTMLHLIGLVWPVLAIGALVVAQVTGSPGNSGRTATYVDTQPNSGLALGVAETELHTAGVAGLSSTMLPAVLTSEKPITLPPPVLAPSGRNIISNVYFPIEKLNKNLISSNGSPATIGTSSGSNSNSYVNNKNMRRRSQGQMSDGLNDLRLKPDLINSPVEHHDQSQPAMLKRPSTMSSSMEREATNVTAQLNNHAYLNCKLNRTLLQISQVSNKSVSWVRRRDDHILTVNRVTFIADERFNSFYDEANGVWTLQVKYVREEDNGYYECQVGTEPKLSAQVLLNVVVPKTEMVGETIRYVKGGSNVILRCIVKDAIEPPIYISWFYNGHQIYNENNHGWKMTFERNILTGSDGPSQGLSPGDGSISPLSSAASASSASPGFYHRSSSAAANVRFKSIGSLIIPSVRKRDTGNYTCSPSNSAPVTVNLHVIHGDYSASAITSSSSRGRLSDLITIIISVVLLNAT